MDSVDWWFSTSKWKDSLAGDTLSLTFIDTVASLRRVDLCLHDEPSARYWAGRSSRSSVNRDVRHAAAHPHDNYWCFCGARRSTPYEIISTAMILAPNVLRTLVGDTKNGIWFVIFWFLGTLGIVFDYIFCQNRGRKNTGTAVVRAGTASNRQCFRKP